MLKDITSDDESTNDDADCESGSSSSDEFISTTTNSRKRSLKNHNHEREKWLYIKIRWEVNGLYVIYLSNQIKKKKVCIAQLVER